VAVGCEAFLLHFPCISAALPLHPVMKNLGCMSIKL
jgi:hypothetical protein